MTGRARPTSPASRQATALATGCRPCRATVGSPSLLVGDFNSYTQEDPLQILYDAGYTDVASALEPTSQSYSFSGLSGSLDHVLLNGRALDRATGADIWNINSGESIALEYSRYNYHGTLLLRGRRRTGPPTTTR